MDIYNLSLAELKAMPTLSTGQADDLKYEAKSVRVWLSRCSVADGEPFDNKVEVEIYDEDAGWVINHSYAAK